MTRSFAILAAILTCSAPALVGCAPKPGPAITGVVTMDSQPLGNARVVFEPLDPMQSLGGAIAVTDSAGAFKIEPHPTTGETLKIGEYRVSVSRKTDAQGNVPAEIDYPQLEAAGQLRESVPEKYLNNPGTTPELKATIQEGENKLKFDLVK